jgi:hypothetical protein
MGTPLTRPPLQDVGKIPDIERHEDPLLYSGELEYSWIIHSLQLAVFVESQYIVPGVPQPSADGMPADVGIEK